MEQLHQAEPATGARSFGCRWWYPNRGQWRWRWRWRLLVAGSGHGDEQRSEQWARSRLAGSAREADVRSINVSRRQVHLNGTSIGRPPCILSRRIVGNDDAAQTKTPWGDPHGVFDKSGDTYFLECSLLIGPNRLTSAFRTGTAFPPRRFYGIRVGIIARPFLR